jgi:hypothetical protein
VANEPWATNRRLREVDCELIEEINVYFYDMNSRRIILLLTGLIVFLGFLQPARGAYFPDPVPTGEWDILYGDIVTGTYGPSSEVAGWDQSGTLRFRADILTDEWGPYFDLTEFYGPPTGSTDPNYFTWRIFDGMTLWSATIDSTNWTAWQGQGSSFMLNLDRGDQPLHLAPEPATMLVLGLLGGSGLIAGLKKRKRLKINT